MLSPEQGEAEAGDQGMIFIVFSFGKKRGGDSLYLLKKSLIHYLLKVIMENLYPDSFIKILIKATLSYYLVKSLKFSLDFRFP